MGRLRDEILQSQQARSDLLKWKLVLVGVIGSVGLGLAGSRVSAHADLVLCAVPLVCVYVDLLCRHLSLRILVIGSFFREPIAPAGDAAERAEAAVLSAYETYAREARNSTSGDVFRLEDWAVSSSTYAVSVAVLVYGAFVLAGSSADHVAAGLAFIVSGAAGLLATRGANDLYQRRREALDRLTPAR